MERGGELDVIGAEFEREGHPFLDGQIRVGVALLTRRQLLQRGGQNADLHEFWLESFDGHSASLLGKAVRSPAFRPQASDAATFRGAKRFRLKAGLRTALFILSSKHCDCVARWRDVES